MLFIKPIENKAFLISATDTIELHFLSRLGLPPVNNLDDYNYTIFFTNFIYGNTITLTASYLLCNTPIKPEVNYYGKGPISLKPLPVGCMQDEFLKPGSYNIRAPTLIDSHSAIRWHPIFKPNEFIIKTSDSPRIIEISYKELIS